MFSHVLKMMIMIAPARRSWSSIEIGSVEDLELICNNNDNEVSC